MTDERTPSSLRQAITIVNDQLGIDPAPVLPPPSPFLRNILHRKIKQLEQAVIGREDRAGFGRLPKLAIETLDRIRRIDQFSQFLLEFEVGAQIRPVLIPGLCNLRVFAVPDCCKFVQSMRSRIYTHSWKMAMCRLTTTVLKTRSGRSRLVVRTGCSAIQRTERCAAWHCIRSLPPRRQMD